MQEEIFFCRTYKIVQDTNNNFTKARVTDFIVYSVTDVPQILV